ncbi:MAG TPA: hypothetical protein VGJ28_18665 [Micromonosporaceae bacterium]|jgi:hypothetical protein
MSAQAELTELSITDVEPRVWESSDDELFGAYLTIHYDSCGSGGSCVEGCMCDCVEIEWCR